MHHHGARMVFRAKRTAFLNSLALDEYFGRLNFHFNISYKFIDFLRVVPLMTHKMRRLANLIFYARWEFMKITITIHFFALRNASPFIFFFGHLVAR